MFALSKKGAAPPAYLSSPNAPPASDCRRGCVCGMTAGHCRHSGGCHPSRSLAFLTEFVVSPRTTAVKGPIGKAFKKAGKALIAHIDQLPDGEAAASRSCLPVWHPGVSVLFGLSVCLPAPPP
jgi:hypothetical protein